MGVASYMCTGARKVTESMSEWRVRKGALAYNVVSVGSYVLLEHRLVMVVDLSYYCICTGAHGIPSSH